MPPATIRLTASALLGFLLIASAAPAQTTPQESLKSLKAPEGFEIALWATEPMLVNPTNMDIDSRGRVWIAEGENYRFFRNTTFKRKEGADRIKILADTDGDGKADKMTVFADNIYPVPMGIAVQEIWKDGKYSGARVYVGNSPDLLVLEDTDGDDKADNRYPLLTGFGGIDHDHGVHGMFLGPDGKLYFTQGDGGYAAKPGETVIPGATFNVLDKSGRRLQSDQLGTALRCNLDGTQFERIAFRLRNDYETCVDSFGNVFISDNDDDGNRGVRTVWAMDGGNYGYRSPGSTRHWAEELPGIIPKLVGVGNGSPCGILINEGGLFSKAYDGSLFQIDAGTHQINWHPLVRQGGGYRSDYKVLLGGTDPWFRPVDAAIAPDGSMFLCDWYDAGVGGHSFADQTTGRVYHLRPKAKQPAAKPNDFATIDGLIAALGSPNVATRFAARQGLVERGGQAREATMKLFREGQPRERGRALFVLAALPETGKADVVAALKDQEPRIREQALRILARDIGREAVVEPESAKTAEPPAVAVLSDILPLAADPDAGVRRELLLDLRNVETAKVKDALLKLAAGWDGQDRYYLEALRLALVQREPAFQKEVFDSLTKAALSESGATANQIALPPYYPTTTNDAYLHIDDQLPPATGASKVIGLAWSLQSSQALPALASLVAKSKSPAVARGVDIALGVIADPKAAEVLIDQFLGTRDPNRQREILGELGAKLGKPWRPMLFTPKMKQVLKAALASEDLRVEAIRAIARSGATGYAEQLMTLASNEDGELSTRAAAIEALGDLRHAPAREMVAKLVEQAKGQPQAGPLALAGLSALSAFSGEQAQELLDKTLRDDAYPLDARRRALQILGSTQPGGNRLLAMAREKKLPPELATDATFLLHNHPDRSVMMSALRELPLPKTAGGKQIKNLQDVLALRGHVDDGKKVFNRERSDACARCHRVQGIGNWVGPDLSSIGTKYGQKELLFHVLNPSGAIGDNYVPFTLALDDGRVLTGLITDESADRLVLKTAAGERLVIRADEIESRRPQNKSIMPENLAESLSEQDLADLIAYMSTLRQPVSPVGEYYLLGPLEKGSHDGAKRPALDASSSGGSESQWRRMTTSRDNYLDLASLLGSKEGKEVFCYLPIVSDAGQTARVVINSPSAIAVWQNGQAIATNKPRKIDLNTLWELSVPLKEGSNDLVIRVSSGQINAGLITTLITDQPIRFDFERTK